MQGLYNRPGTLPAIVHLWTYRFLFLLGLYYRSSKPLDRNLIKETIASQTVLGAGSVGGV